MAADPDFSPPLLPVIPEYTSWTGNVRESATRDAAAADASFAGRHGPISAAEPPAEAGPSSPEESRGGLADETA
ncbi:conserved hypothetical protein [Solidesulfovibrio fructosivorans JJ]]|uniref:Uncharacterized protein n=1 Tax=Solidesulfovibrio fructosivorans JJ] TaxID=596151 RepID=E1JY99_SOLFR|nr:hypothetical protein [Solidesulfovibrio fructosivorans]EFL50673.1 conserved hypothetical protein [Solidesulfovibrio fructosivorans JJ]]